MCPDSVVLSGIAAVCLAFGSLYAGCSSGGVGRPVNHSTPQFAAQGDNRQEDRSPVERKRGGVYSIRKKTYVAPIVVEDVFMTLDGGTLTLRMVDSRGRRLWTCNDGRLGPGEAPSDQRPLYVGGYHPSSPAAKALPLGGPDEQELNRMLKDWFEEAKLQGGPRFPGEHEKMKVQLATKFIDYLQWHVKRHKPE